MHDGPSPVIKVLHWRGTYLYLYRPTLSWLWKRWRYEINRSRSGRVVSRRIFAGPIELSW